MSNQISVKRGQTYRRAFTATSVLTGGPITLQDRVLHYRLWRSLGLPGEELVASVDQPAQQLVTVDPFAGRFDLVLAVEDTDHPVGHYTYVVYYTEGDVERPLHLRPLVQDLFAVTPLGDE